MRAAFSPIFFKGEIKMKMLKEISKTNNGYMTVVFDNDLVYWYMGVPEEVFEEFQKEKTYRYFNLFIRDRYPYMKVG
jgi:hypothetical protein